MAEKLTKTFVDKIPYPDTGQVYYRDTELKGFGVRVGSGSKVYIAEAKIDRKTIRVTIGRHGLFAPEQARNEAKSILAMISRGINPNDADKARKAKSVTLAEVHTAYLKARSSLAVRTVYDYNRFNKTYFEEWQNKPLTEISKDMIERMHRKIGQRSEAQANLAMRYMRAIFNFAAGQYEDANGNAIINDNPINRLSQTRSWYRVDRKQTVIKPYDLYAWFDAVNRLPTLSQGANRHAVKDYLLLLIFTGLRREEGLGLQWRDVDFRGKTFTIPDPKNRQSHTLPMTPFIFEMLKKRHEENFEGSAFVFPGNGRNGYMDDPNKQMKIVIDESGVVFTPHDLRRTFITIADSLDISSYALKRLANHKMANDVTAGYIIGDAERLRDPMLRITNYLLMAMKSPMDNPA